MGARDVADYDIQFQGFNELEKMLKDASNLDDVKEVIKEDTAYMAKRINQNTPRKTRYLVRSETVDIVDNGLTGKVTAHAEYSAYVEYGTRFFYGRFYMKKGQAETKQKFFKDMEALCK